MAALEAMACEVPVIASRVGGLPEVVTDGENGYLSPVGDVDKMAVDAARLLTDPKLRREMGQRARDSAISRYRTDVVIPQYISFYEEVLAKTLEAAFLSIVLHNEPRWRITVKKFLLSTSSVFNLSSSGLAQQPNLPPPPKPPEQKQPAEAGSQPPHTGT